jgi:hypothetical protein
LPTWDWTTQTKQGERAHLEPKTTSVWIVSIGLTIRDWVLLNVEKHVHVLVHIHLWTWMSTEMIIPCFSDKIGTIVCSRVETRHKTFCSIVLSKAPQCQMSLQDLLQGKIAVIIPNTYIRFAMFSSYTWTQFTYQLKRYTFIISTLQMRELRPNVFK